MILRYTDRAKDDVELAFVWYEKQRSINIQVTIDGWKKDGVIQNQMI